MVALSILGCMLMAYFFMALTAIIKGISAFLDTMVEMIERPTSSTALPGMLRPNSSPSISQRGGWPW